MGLETLWPPLLVICCMTSVCMVESLYTTLLLCHLTKRRGPECRAFMGSCWLATSCRTATGAWFSLIVPQHSFSLHHIQIQSGTSVSLVQQTAHHENQIFFCGCEMCCFWWYLIFSLKTRILLACVDVEFIGITCILTDIDKFHSKPCLFQGYIMLKDKLSFPQ